MRRVLGRGILFLTILLIFGCGETKKETKYVEKELNPPKAPSGLIATSVSSSQIDLSWVDNSGNGSRFELWRKTEGEIWGLVSELPADTVSYSDTGLEPETEYFYQIRACNRDGCSSFSEIASATTQPSPQIPPNAPSGLSASALSSSQILLTWQDNSDNEDGFKIERDDGTGFQEIATISANQTSYLDEGLSPSTTYAYQIKAYNSAGDSGYSNQAQATTFDLTASCQGYCGEQGAGGCWCDQSCWDYGDCCSDICEVCGFCGPACVDADGDGYFTNPRCGTAVDCDDSDSTIYPGAPEICDYQDNQCPGDPGYGLVDETCSWARTFGGSNNDVAESIQQTSDGGYIVAGGTRSFGAGGTDFLVIKLDNSGNQIWAKTFGGSNDDSVGFIQQTQDEGYIITGFTKSLGAGGQDCWVLKLDTNGNLVWDKLFGGAGNDSGYQVQQTQDGGYFIAGRNGSYGAGGYDFWALKLDANGNLLWEKVYGGTGNEWARSGQETNDGGYILVGPTNSFGVGSDAWVLKLDSAGNKVWAKNYGEDGVDSPFYIQQTQDNGYIMTGYTTSFGAGGKDVWVLKLDSNGNILCEKTFGGQNDDWGKTIIQTLDEEYVVSAVTDSFGNGEYDLWIIKLDNVGNKIWEKTYGGSFNDVVGGKSIKQTLDEGYIIAGGTNSLGAGGSDVWILKLDENGDCLGSGCP